MMAEENKKNQPVSFLKGFDKASINSWVAENIKTIQDAFNFQKKLSTTTFPTTTTEVSPVSSALQQWVRETAKKIGTSLAKPWQEAYQRMVQRILEAHPEWQISRPSKEWFKQMMPQGTEKTMDEVGFTPLTEEASKHVEKEFISISQERQIREIFDNLVNMGFFQDRDRAFPIWKDLIAYAVTSPNGQIPYWSNLALWQVGVADKLTNLYQYAEQVAKAYTEAGTPMTASNVINILYADTFETIWEMKRRGGFPIQLPGADIRYLFDPNSENRQMITDITKDWVRRVYAGYKLLKTEPPEPIKILYHTLFKGTSATAILEEGIYSIGQDIQQATGETAAIPVIETTSEPEVYTIQTQFLRK
jgi:hypothetical protein